MGTKPKKLAGLPTATDRRVLRTRNALGDALVVLMQEKNFNDISIQEVLDRAGVARSTFYVHYRDKDDLFLSDVEDFFQTFSTILERTDDTTMRLAPVRELCAHLLGVRQFYEAVRLSEKMNDVRTLGQGFFARSIEQRLERKGKVTDPVQRAAHGHALAGSLLSLIDWWIDKGMKHKPEKIDELFHNLAWHGLAHPHSALTNK